MSQFYSGQSAVEDNVPKDIEWEMRPYKEGDIPAIVALANAVDAVYKLGEPVTEEDIRNANQTPRSDPARQVVVVTGPHMEGVPAGMLLGSGRLMYDNDESGKKRIYYLQLLIHPAVEGLGLEGVIARKLLEIAASYEQDPGMTRMQTARIKAYVREEIVLLRTLFADMGMREMRKFWVMERSLHEPVDEPQVIEGVHIRGCNHPEDSQSALEAFNNSFEDHFDFQQVPEEDWNFWLTTPQMRLDLSWLAEDAEAQGKIAGFCICMISEASNKQKGACEGWIELLGTTRDWRRKGLGRSLLLHGLHSLRSAGMDTALLGVDSESLTGANRLYESVGFRLRSREVQYECGLGEITF